jgi:uncharacterized phage protein (TIGR02218 family)
VTLQSHLATGATTVCRCWAVYRKDGVVLGFTDHDLDLWFEGVLFRAGSGLSSGALAQATGLAVDNAEAVGALSDASVSEADLRAGRYDEAEVRLWLVNWADTSERRLQFRGSLGEVSCAAGQFRAELRGLTEALNRPHRRVYQRDCGAVLGDRRCGVVLGVPQWSAEVAMIAMVDSVTVVTDLLPHAPGWFERGRVVFLSGPAIGLALPVKADRIKGGQRWLELWRMPGVMPLSGDLLRVEAGCDRQAETCRTKFGNFANFRGFPDIPGDDWVTAVPARADIRDGGSRSAP